MQLSPLVAVLVLNMVLVQGRRQNTSRSLTRESSSQDESLEVTHDACSQKTEYGQPLMPLQRAQYRNPSSAHFNIKPVTGKQVWAKAQRYWTDSCWKSNRCEWFPISGFSDGEGHAINGVCIPSTCYGLISKDVCENWSGDKPWGYERDEKLWEVEDQRAKYETFSDFVGALPLAMRGALLEKRCTWTTTDWNLESTCVKASEIMPATSICPDLAGPFQRDTNGHYYPSQAADVFEAGFMLHNMPMPCETDAEKQKFTDSDGSCKKGNADVSVLQLAGLASKTHTTLQRFHVALHVRPLSTSQQKLLLGRQIDVYLDPSDGKYLEMTRLEPLFPSGERKRFNARVQMSDNGERKRFNGDRKRLVPADADNGERKRFDARVHELESQRVANASVKIDGWSNMKMVMITSGAHAQTRLESFISENAQSVVGKIMRQKLADKLSTAFLKMVDNLGGSLGSIIAWIGDIADFGSFEFSMNAKCMTISNFRSVNGSSTGGSLRNFRRIFNTADGLASWWAWASNIFGSTVVAYYYAMAEMLHELGLQILENDGVVSLRLTLPPRDQIENLKAKAAAKKLEAEQRAKQWAQRKSAARALVHSAQQSMSDVQSAMAETTVSAATRIQHLLQSAWLNIKNYWYGAPDSVQVLAEIKAEIQAFDLMSRSTFTTTTTSQESGSQREETFWNQLGKLF